MLRTLGSWGTITRNTTAGVRLVWVVDPMRSLARVYRADGTETLLAAGDALDGEDVLPGFSCPLREFL